MNKKNQIRGDKDNPYHLSIGQVVFNEDKNIALIKKPDGRLTLPRETAYLNESFLECIRRGGEEELGIVVEPVRYLGALLTDFDREPGVPVEKSTQYFLTKAGETCRKAQEDDEVDDDVLWVQPKEAIRLLSEQDNPESKIVSRAMHERNAEYLQ